MTNQDQPKKMSLQDAIKQKLADKKQNAAGGSKSGTGPVKTLGTMKSQQTKKASNTRRKMGV